MMDHRIGFFAAFAGSALIGGSAIASVDTSSPPSGVFKLKPGIYVQQGSTCEGAANAAIRSYDGKGIGTAHTHACKAKILAQHGRRYTISQSCIDVGSGPGKRFTERQIIEVRDALTFRQKGATYRYCPIYQLPPDLRSVAPQ